MPRQSQSLSAEDLNRISNDDSYSNESPSASSTTGQLGKIGIPPASAAPPAQYQQLLQPVEAATPPSSGSRKKASAAPSRTGQACDRCKTRKIRCDNTAGGCLPCRQNNTECRTTDRVTQRATVRGHTEHLETQNNNLRQQLRALEQQLREAGIEPKSNTQPGPYSKKYESQRRAQSEGRDHYDSSTEREGSRRHDASEFAALPAFRAGLVGDNYLGVSNSNGLEISPVKGMSLSLFGATLDLANFLPPSADDPASPTSYQAILSTCMTPRQESLEDSLKLLPETYDDCSKQMEWWLMALNPWFPVVRKKDFRNLIMRVYQGPKPSTAEFILLHMALAHLKYQTSMRNADGSDGTEMYQQSFAHFRTALGFVPDMVHNRTVADMQALALICQFVRGFPKSGAAWMMSSWILNIAIELGYHRSSKAWDEEGRTLDAADDDTRKRVFWSLLMINTAVSGKLGRPMPLHPTDFDVELPDAADDDDQAEPGAPKAVRCSILGTMQFWKMTEVFLDNYSCIYAIRQTNNLEESINRIEGKINKWRQELPVEFTNSSIYDKDIRIKIFALWIQYWDCECQLLLHHPSLSRSSSPAFIHQNLMKATAAASKLIEVIGQLANLRCLDTTWHNTSTYIAAVFTLLFSVYQRRDQITSEEFARLQTDMNTCLDILAEVGAVLGSGQKLRNTVEELIQNTLDRINRSRAEKSASATISRSRTGQASQPPELQPVKSEELRPAPVQGGLQSNVLPERGGYRSNVYPIQAESATQSPQAQYVVGEQAYAQAPITHRYHTPDAARSSFQLPNQHIPADGHIPMPVTVGYSYDGIRAWHSFMDASSRGAIPQEEYIGTHSHTLLSMDGRDVDQGDAVSTNPYLGQMPTHGFHGLLVGADAAHWPAGIYNMEDPQGQHQR